MMKVTGAKVLDFLGRAALAGIFVNAVPGKITGFAGTVGYITAKGIPEPLAAFLLVCAIIVLLAGSLLFVFGRDTKLGAALLLVFLIPTTLIFHSFPPDAGLVRNLALVGALILGITRSKAGTAPGRKPAASG